jgi:hypothetical protein
MNDEHVSFDGGVDVFASEYVTDIGHRVAGKVKKREKNSIKSWNSYSTKDGLLV